LISIPLHQISERVTITLRTAVEIYIMWRVASSWRQCGNRLSERHFKTCRAVSVHTKMASACANMLCVPLHTSAQNGCDAHPEYSLVNYWTGEGDINYG